MGGEQAIKSMKLYHSPERIFNELKALGIKEDDILNVEQLVPFDQYHYLGTDAIDEAIKILSIDAQSRMMEVGSGIGGPARYLASQTECHVTAMELQSDLHEVASSLTERCGLENRVQHLCANILDYSANSHNFDGLVSWLCFLHISDRKTLLKNCYEILKQNGKILIEDFYKRGELTEEEQGTLSEDIYCDYLPTLEEYQNQLLENGFVEVQVVDKTQDWLNFVKERSQKFIENRQRHITIHGLETVEGLENFYRKIVWLFENGNLGGARIIATKGLVS